MTFTIPNIFIAGKKAVALEVNENFNVIKNELNRQSENLNITSGLAEKTDTYVNGELKEELKNLIKTAKASFCVNSGNKNANGEADLLAIDSISPMRVIFKIGDGQTGNMPNVIYSNYKGEQSTRANLPAVNMTGKTDGTYNIFAKISGSPYALNNKIYRQTKRPEMLADDIWMDISTIPVRALQYNGVEDVEFNDVPLGQVTIKEGALNSTLTFPYNQNGFDVNSSSEIEINTNLSKSIAHIVMPDYSKGISKTMNVLHTAETDGFLLAFTYERNGQNNSINVNSISVWQGSINDGDGSNGTTIPIAKGNTFQINFSNGGTATFYPLIGA